MKELNAALGAQTARIIATVNRTEDRLREDNKDVSKRVTSIEKRGRNENVLASVLTFISAILVSKFTGGNG